MSKEIIKTIEQLKFQVEHLFIRNTQREKDVFLGRLILELFNDLQYLKTYLEDLEKETSASPISMIDNRISKLECWTKFTTPDCLQFISARIDELKNLKSQIEESNK